MRFAALLLCFQGQTPVEPKELPVGPEPTAFLAYSFSPDSTRILYSKVDDAKNFDPQKRNIWIAQSDGSNAELITSGVGAVDWLRDGKGLLYVKSAATGPDLCLFDLATKKEKSLGIKLAVRAAHCSPAADRLVLMADLGNRSTQGFTCNLDGTDVRQITFAPGSAYNPLWSPDGKRIVFYRELGDRKDQVYSMDPDGTDLRRLSDPAAHNVYPDFGPGGVISYTVQVSEKQKKVVTCDPGGKLLSVFPYSTSRLRWSPDGKMAIFAAGEFPMMALYVSQADGSQPKRVGLAKG